MATLKLVLDQRRKREDNLYPVLMRLGHKSKSRDINTNVKLHPEQFSAGVIANEELNDEINTLLLSYRVRMRQIVNDNPSIDISTLKDLLLGISKRTPTIREFWEAEIQRLIVAKRESGARVYERILSAVDGAMNVDAQFKDISFKTLLDLETKLYKRGMSTNGIAAYMRTIRAICNKAIDHDIVDFGWYPFRKYKIRKEKTTPRTLTIKEIQQYFKLDLPTSHPLYYSWCIGKLIFMLRGINVKDLMLLKPDNIADGRVIYKRAKTGRIYSIAVLPEMEEYWSKEHKTLTGILSDHAFSNSVRLVKLCEQKRKVVNSHLMEIGKLLKYKQKLTTYVFRYTYANIARQLGFNKELIAEALGHEYGNSITGIYLENYDLKLVDEMNATICHQIMKGD